MSNEVVIERIVQRVVELPDRTSPSEWPDAMIVTGKELAGIIRAVLDQSQTTAVGDWGIDTSTGRRILVYKNCSVIEDEQADVVLTLLGAATAGRIVDADDDIYELGKRDGYEQAVQDIDIATGGDGEYRYSTDGDPDRHTPDAATMKLRIVDRFQSRGGSGVERWLPVSDEARRCRECNSERKGDFCWKCGATTFKPHPLWVEPELPDVARVRALAKEVGYAIGEHGSRERDLDLIAAPWRNGAVDAKALVQHIADGLGARVVGEPELKPLGRYGVCIQLDGYFKLIDLSVCAGAAPSGDRLRRLYAIASIAQELMDTELAGAACTGSQAPVEDALGRLQEALGAHCEQAADCAGGRVVTSASRLVDRLRAVHRDPAFEAVWRAGQAAHGPYAGPTYTECLEALEVALEGLSEGRKVALERG